MTGLTERVPEIRRDVKMPWALITGPNGCQGLIHAEPMPDSYGLGKKVSNQEELEQLYAADLKAGTRKSVQFLELTLDEAALVTCQNHPEDKIAFFTPAESELLSTH